MRSAPPASIVLGAALLAFAASVGAQPTGKNSVFNADTSVVLNDGLTGDGVLLDGAIVKEKKKTVIAVAASVSMSVRVTKK